MLARLYNQLLRFVERDLCRIMSLAEKVSVKPYNDKAADTLPEANGGSEERRGFQIMSHVVWDEFGRSIMNEIGGVVFAAGNPKEFRKVCYTYLSAQKHLFFFFHSSITKRLKPFFVHWNYLHLHDKRFWLCVNVLLM